MSFKRAWRLAWLVGFGSVVGCAALIGVDAPDQETAGSGTTTTGTTASTTTGTTESTTTTTGGTGGMVSSCDGGACALKANGTACAGNAECNSGECVTDDTAPSAKVCCATACTAGTAASCGEDGNCKHDGSACADFSSTTVCLAAACVDGANSSSANAASICTGSGTCTAGAVTPCGAYKCTGPTGTCKTSCTSATETTDCAAGNYCNGTICVTKLTQSTACTAADQCATGNCADGVCCNIPCASTCVACKASLQNPGGTDGTCGPALDGTNPHSSCTAQSPLVCGDIGTCNAGACAKVAAMTPCGTSCLIPDGELSYATCNGTGTCVSGSFSACPGNYMCANTTTCKTTCTMDADCNPGVAPACDTGNCVQCTSTNASNCGGNTQYCDTQADSLKDTCVECDVTADCASPKTCSASHTCM